MLLGIDISNLVVRHYHACLSAGICDPAGHPVGGAVGALKHVARLIDRIRPAYLLIGKDTSRATSIRRQLHREYKANRTEQDDELERNFDLTYQALDLLRWPVREADGWEADDVIASACAVYRGQVQVVSGDQDMLALCSDTVKIRLLGARGGYQLCGPDECKAKLGVRPDQVQDYRAMVGKSNDYQGVPDVGPKTAVRVLTSCDTLADAYRLLDEEQPIPGVSATQADRLRAGRAQARVSWQLAGLKRDIPVDGPGLSIAAARPLAAVREPLCDLGLQHLFSTNQPAPRAVAS